MKKHLIRLLFSFSICLTFLQASAQFPVEWTNTTNVVTTTNSIQVATFGVGEGLSTNFLPLCQDGYFDFSVVLNGDIIHVGFSTVPGSSNPGNMFELWWNANPNFVNCSDHGTPLGGGFCSPTDVFRIAKIGSNLFFSNRTTNTPIAGPLPVTTDLYIGVWMNTGSPAPHPSVTGISPNFSDKCGVENSWVGMGSGIMSPIVATDRIQINNLPHQDTLDTILVTNNTGIIHRRTLADWYEVGNVPHLPNDINDDKYTFGNIGIGINIPSQRLQVSSGNVLLDHASGGTTGNLYFGGLTDQNQNGLRLSGAHSFGSYNGFIDLRTYNNTGGLSFRVDQNNGATERMKILSDGNVGIGTGLPTSRLHVVANNTWAATFIPSGANNPFIHLGDPFGFPGMALINNGNRGDVRFNGTDLEFAVGTGPGGVGSGVTITPNTADRLTVNGSVVPSSYCGYTLGTSALRWSEVFACNGTINTSDMRLKENITDLNYGLADIMKLRPVSYTWKNESGGRKLGLIAQELQGVISEVVKVGDDENQTLGVFYSDLIPVLIKGMQEQNATIEQLQEKVRVFEATCCAKSSETVIPGQNATVGDNTSGAYLKQNEPNPSEQNTVIKMYLPATTANASLHIYDMNGKEIKSIPVNTKGEETSITINAGELVAGMYMYALLADGKEIDTKKMIITR